MRNLLLVSMLALSAIMAAFPETLQSAMSDYCSKPPYVTRTIAPNIMVLMDNSADMRLPAYDGEYLPNPTKDNYSGYFKPQVCYSYSGGKFSEGVTDASGNCTAAAPFRGNLLNWATMSRYDLLQKVLVGGNATSKQGNAHTLVSISGGDWPDKTFSNCIFRTNNGNLTITENAAGACTLLDSPAIPIAFQPPPLGGRLLATSGREVEDFPSSLFTGVKGLLTSATDSLGKWSLTSEAWAAAACNDITTGPLNGSVGTDFDLKLYASGCNNCTFTWSSTTVPAWLNSSPVTSETSVKKTNGAITWSGTPTGAGTYPFSASVSSDDCTGTRTISGNIAIAAASLKINTTALAGGQVGTVYSFAMNGQGGTTPWAWSATGVPAGLAMSSDGILAGIPEVAGSSSVTVTLADSGTPAQSVLKTFTLTIGSSNLTITTGTLPVGTTGQPYSFNMQGAGGSAPYSWSITGGGLPPGLSMDAAGRISGTPTANGTWPVTIALQDSVGTTVSRGYSLQISASTFFLEITSPATLPEAVKDESYTYTLQGAGGAAPYTWSVAGAPAGLAVSSAGVISWTPAAGQVQDTPYTFTITVRDSFGTTVSKVLSIKVVRSPVVRSSSFTVKVSLPEEDFTDRNGNGIWDQGEFIDSNSNGIKDAGEVDFVDANGNGVWDGKQGVFQKFWDVNKPKARWGLTMFGRTGATTIVDLNSCIPASPASAFYTSVQNATATTSSPLAKGLYGDINYYGFNSPYGTGYTGCNNSDPIDNVPCRKNFVLILSSGSDVTGTAFAADAALGCSETEPLVQNACYGVKKDLRSDKDGKQNVYTYVVNTMGTVNNTVLEQAAIKGGGKYYDATNITQLEDKLKEAFEDILAQAASGTAVSVLTTSSRGIGSMVQAYFLPVKQEGEREVSWTGFSQNLWIDPMDNLREDSTADFTLNLTQDKILKLFFDSTTKETKAALFSDANGDGSLDSCTSPTIQPFSEIKYTWEGGKKLALKSPPTRKLFTSKEVIRVDSGGTATTTSFSPTAPANLYPEFSTAMATGLKNALDADAIYTADNIVRYVRGECLETGVSGATDCGATPGSVYRDRRVSVTGGAANGNVWKLGDIISSTPKVISNTPSNTYHIDYGDSSYFQYITDSTYKQRSSLAIVGANDGVLHAFRVGYLKDSGTGITGSIKALFKNFFASADTETGQLGEEVWGFIPYNAFPYLKYLANPDYCHIYYNDLSVRLVDASLGCTGDTSCDEPSETRVENSWRTVLIGGMRFGGACSGGVPSPPVADKGFSAYYAIDITNPESPVPLWEFSDEDMGYATSFPSIARTGARDKNGNWYVVLGSGSTTLPKSDTDIDRSSNGYIYILNLKTGALVKKINLGHHAIVGDVLAVDEDKDYNSEKIYFGTTYKDTTWKGKLVRIDIPNQDLSATWTPTIKTLFSDNFPFTASTDAAKDASGNVWVYAGSGKYYSDVDEIDSSAQIFLGFKDVPSGITYPFTKADLDNRTSDPNVTGTETKGDVTGTSSACLYDPTDNTFKSQNFVTSISQTSTALNTPAKGWYINLSGGERVITRPLAIGGLVDFLTYKPSVEPCSYGGDSYLYAVGYTTGVAPASVAIRAPETTNNQTTGNVTVAKGILLGPGAPPTGEAIIIPPPKEGQEQLKKKIQIATGVIVEAENTPVLSVISKIVHMLKK